MVHFHCVIQFMDRVLARLSNCHVIMLESGENGINEGLCIVNRKGRS